MRKNSLIQRGLSMAVVIGTAGVLVTSCVKESSVVDQIAPETETVIETRAPDFHWPCENEDCLFPLNGGWQSDCSQCGKGPSTAHTVLLRSFMDSGATTAKTTAEGIGEIDNNRIQITTLVFTAIAPEPWFDTYKALQFYDNLKTLGYYSDPKYAKGVDYAWYRTVRVLYPGKTIMSKVGTTYDKWMLSEGRFLKDAYGRGIKAGSKAAVDAFLAR